MTSPSQPTSPSVDAETLITQFADRCFDSRYADEGASYPAVLAALTELAAALSAPRVEPVAANDVARRLRADECSHRAMCGEAAHEIERLREALEPFAREADTHGDQIPDDMFIWDYEPPPPAGSRNNIRVGDLRRARAALAALSADAGSRKPALDPATVEACAKIAEKLSEDPKWSPHYKNASLAIADKIRRLAGKDGA